MTAPKSPAGSNTTVPVTGELPGGDKVTLAIRPEQCRLSEDSESANLRGELREVVYIGTEYGVRT